MMSRRSLLRALALARPAVARSGSRTVPASESFPLNGGWLFGLYQAGAEAAGFDDRHLHAVTLPHCAAWLPANGWLHAKWEHLWIYRRHFRRPGPAGGRVFADFDGVMTNATVLCNDRVVAGHAGGYLPFSAELTGSLTSGGNVLSVIVDSRWLGVPPVVPGEDAHAIDFFQPGGIYRDVTLRVTPRVYVSDLFAMPCDVLSANPRLNIECGIDGGSAGAGTASLLVELVDRDGRVIASTAMTAPVRPGISSVRRTLDRLGPVSLWSPASPVLYTVRATLTAPGIGISKMSRRIGFRETSFRPDGFYLNGERLQLFGLNRHQLFPYTGMAMPARVQRKDAEILRNEFNCNVVRCSHYPQSPAFLDACDELGLLVWQEAPGWHQISDDPDWQRLVIRNVQDMVTRDRSRPSVIAWGTRLNETPDDPDLWAATRQAAKDLDPSRPSTGAMDQHSTAAWAEDVFAFNDYTASGEDGLTLMPPISGVPYLISESVGVLKQIPAHFTWTDPPAVLARQAALHAQAHNAAAAGLGYAGLIAWAAFDYGSLRGHPDQTKWAGIADCFRVAKPGAAVYQSQCDPQTRVVIEPAFFWEPGGAQPQGEPLLIASNCEQLSMYIGGAPAGTARPAADDERYGSLAYPPFLVSLPAAGPQAELRIDGYIGGRLAARRVMAPGPAGDRLRIYADDAAIRADGSDMTRLVFRACDRHGNQRRCFADTVKLRLAGPGELVGENPFPFGEYGGLGAVWIRSRSGRAGLISVAASHPGLGRDIVTVQSR
jgi:beta-galactosidase